MVDSDNPATADQGAWSRPATSPSTWLASNMPTRSACATKACWSRSTPPSLPAGADGTPAADDFLPGAVTECAVSTDIWSTVFAYDTTKFTGDGPTTVADFFDLEKFPGKRGLRRAPRPFWNSR